MIVCDGAPNTPRITILTSKQGPAEPMSTQSRLSGIFTPNIVPLDSRGEIDEPELRRYVDWLIERGVHGLYPNGSTGEFTRFTAEERRRIIEIMADQTRGRVPRPTRGKPSRPASTITASACGPSPSCRRSITS